MSAIRGKVVAVTGAGSGIGRALTLGLAQRGARAVVISDVNEADLDQTAESVAGAEVFAERVDVGDRDAVVSHAGAAAERFGVVHQVYGNAGVAFRRTVLESDWADYERVLRVNLWGVIHTTKAFLPYVIASGDGHVVNVSSAAGLIAQPNASHYCTSKFAVRGFTETLRTEMLAERHPVGVTTILPGGIATNIAKNTLEAAKELGLSTPDDERRKRLYEEKVLRTPAERAATMILDGVERDRARVLVGPDAKLLDAAVRLLPSLYMRGIAMAERRFKG